MLLDGSREDALLQETKPPSLKSCICPDVLHMVAYLRYCYIKEDSLNNSLAFNSLVLIDVYNSLDDLHHRISTKECYFTFFFSFFSVSCIFHTKQIKDNNNIIKQIKMFPASISSQGHFNQSWCFLTS